MPHQPHQPARLDAGQPQLSSPLRPRAARRAVSARRPRAPAAAAAGTQLPRAGGRGGAPPRAPAGPGPRGAGPRGYLDAAADELALEVALAREANEPHLSASLVRLVLGEGRDLSG